MNELITGNMSEDEIKSRLLEIAINSLQTQAGFIPPITSKAMLTNNEWVALAKEVRSYTFKGLVMTHEERLKDLLSFFLYKRPFYLLSFIDRNSIVFISNYANLCPFCKGRISKRSDCDCENTGLSSLQTIKRMAIYYDEWLREYREKLYERGQI